MKIMYQVFLINLSNAEGLIFYSKHGEVDLGNATTDEVAQVAWMNRGQIKELVEQKIFVDTSDNLLAHLMMISKKIIAAIKRIYHANGYSIMQNAGKSEC